MLIAVVLVFAVFLFAFHDIMYGFTAFSPVTSWIIAIALAVIGTITRGTFYTAKFLLTISVWAGTLSVFVAIIIGFVVFALMHFTFLNLATFVRRAKTRAEMDEKLEVFKTGVTTIKEAGKVMSGRG
jgi:large-conductance mechanosensitive channel